MKIIKLTTENLVSGCVTDEPAPRFSFAIGDAPNGTKLKSAELCAVTAIYRVQGQAYSNYRGRRERYGGDVVPNGQDVRAVAGEMDNGREV